MARKGKEIQLQREIETQEEWEDMLSKEGLCVIDVYQDWCGPAVGMVGTFRRIKNEIGDDLLKFAIAKSDTIDALEKYRGRCEPCFLFYAGGMLVSVVRGANAPLILRTITEQLAQEHKVLDGQAERKEIKDTVIAQLEEKEKRQEEEAEEEEEPTKEVAVVIIKPDAVQSGKSEEILEEMHKRGIEILRQEERQLTEEEVKNVYIHLQDEPFFNELVAFMTSSPSIVMAITKGPSGENIIKEFRDLIGPTEVEEAKEQAPESLRAKFGSEKYMNAVHGSDSQDTAARELAFFFPDFVAPTVEGKPKIQRTLALIRPDAYKNNKDQIVEKIREAGFKIAMEKEIHLDKEQAEDFYKEHRGQEYFEELTTRMSSGPLLALGLAREDAIKGWRDMLGPTTVEEAKEQQPDSLRAIFSEEGSQINMLHGSDSEETAQKEIEYFFPMQQTIAVIKPDAYGTKDEIIDKIHDAGFKIAARKETTLSREIAEEFYADHKDKEYYNELVEHMTSGPTYFMVLSREGAVDGWRSLIGPTDPSKAKETDPETIRGMYGSDTLKNAVHGSSNPEHAKTQIQKIFEETEEAIVEQQEPLMDPAPEFQRDEDSKDQEKAPSPTPAQKEEDTDQQPTQPSEGQTQEQQAQPEEQAGDKPKSPEPAPAQEEQQQKAEETKPAGEGEQKQEEEAAPKEETKPEEAKEAEEKPTEEKPAEDEPAADKPAETEQSEAKEESAEQKQEEPAKPEADGEAKPESTDDKKDDTEEKKEEQKPEGEGQQQASS